MALGYIKKDSPRVFNYTKNADLVEQEDNIISPSKRGLEEIEFPETKLTKEEKEILEV